MDVRAPGGEAWTVKRRYLHRDLPRFRRGRRKRDGDGWDLLDVGGDDLFGAVLLAVGLLVAAVLAVAFVLPALIFVLELLLVLVVLALGLVGRVLLRRPWTVRARSSSGRVIERQAVGWRASGRAVEELAAQIRAGRVA